MPQTRNARFAENLPRVDLVEPQTLVTEKRETQSRSTDRGEYQYEPYNAALRRARKVGTLVSRIMPPRMPIKHLANFRLRLDWDRHADQIPLGAHA